MDPAVSTPVSGPAEDNNGIPDDLCCKRSDETSCKFCNEGKVKRAKRTPTSESHSYLESNSDEMDSPLGEYPMTPSGSRSMEMDGLLPAIFSRVYPTWHTPIQSQIWVGFIACVLAGLLYVHLLSHVLSVHCSWYLFVIVRVTMAVLAASSLRFRQLQMDPPGFSCPWVPIVPALCILVNIFLFISVALFLESRGMIEEALEVATDPDYRFDLAIQLGKLEIAKLDMAEDCLKHANDLSGLLLLYSSLGDAEGIIKLASLAKENGKNNVAFACLFMLGKLEDCLQLLVDSNRIPAAALMARSYLPNKVSEIVALWRKDLNKVNQKAAESLVDTEEYSNMFEDWQISLEVEARAAETRDNYPPATEYVNYVDRSHVNLVEVFKNMQLDDEEPHENGELDHDSSLRPKAVITRSQYIKEATELGKKARELKKAADALHQEERSGSKGRKWRKNMKAVEKAQCFFRFIRFACLVSIALQLLEPGRINILTIALLYKIGASFPLSCIPFYLLPSVINWEPWAQEVEAKTSINEDGKEPDASFVNSSRPLSEVGLIFRNGTLFKDVFQQFKEKMSRMEIELAIHTGSRHVDRLRLVYASKEAAEIGYVEIKQLSNYYELAQAQGRSYEGAGEGPC
ncbi:coatomer beta' subunit (COPB2) [Artemisia annua]|uniref:Coatomer beta' subunit (COPB2) n=1 Tax=Artemisia annua TaxID=35608 RepID=A0A2U1NME8_ARTAN|nr:coatomer beta' subunit (COPB2) [Artemisia annua]